MIREYEDRMREAQKRLLQGAPQPNTYTPPWLPNHGQGGIWNTTSRMPPIQSRSPVIAPEIRHETIKRYAEAGVPFPLDKDEAFAKLVSFTGELKSYFELENRAEDATLHVTEQTFRLFRLSMPRYMLMPEVHEDGRIGHLAGMPLLLVDDESQQGIFAPLEPFYRFAFV